MAQNLIEKIAQAYAVGDLQAKARAGDFLTLRPRYVMTHDNAGAVISKFLGIGARKVARAGGVENLIRESL